MHPAFRLSHFPIFQTSYIDHSVPDYTPDTVTLSEDTATFHISDGFGYAQLCTPPHGFAKMSPTSEPSSLPLLMTNDRRSMPYDHMKTAGLLLAITCDNLSLLPKDQPCRRHDHFFVQPSRAAHLNNQHFQCSKANAKKGKADSAVISMVMPSSDPTIQS